MLLYRLNYVCKLGVLLDGFGISYGVTLVGGYRDCRFPLRLRRTAGKAFAGKSGSRGRDASEAGIQGESKAGGRGQADR